ncbi:hypothetical protein RISK_005128 [Rhodopirellula islandica]|uniref:Uncharacterized protein n=1 Tax=Rhodopirellula islandica TaxID=595434 RepID=A0A0J1B7X3_RHOIS|nr:hypothetical protein RISK_005128 [Rhodopirellula islandica]
MNFQNHVSSAWLFESSQPGRLWMQKDFKQMKFLRSPRSNKGNRTNLARDLVDAGLRSEQSPRSEDRQIANGVLGSLNSPT